MTQDQLIEELNKYRMKYALSQYALAEVLGCRPETLNRWLTGKKRISRYYLRNVLQLLKGEQDGLNTSTS